MQPITYPTRVGSHVEREPHGAAAASAVASSDSHGRRKQNEDTAVPYSAPSSAVPPAGLHNRTQSVHWVY